MRMWLEMMVTERMAAVMVALMTSEDSQTVKTKIDEMFRLFFFLKVKMFQIAVRALAF